MEEKKAVKISLSTLFLILAVIVIIIMAVFIIKLNSEKSAEVEKSIQLQAQVNGLNGTVDNLQGKIDSISKTINYNNSNNANIQNSNTSLNVKTNTEVTKKNENKILLEGTYAFEASDVGYQFDKKGNVSIFGNVDEQKGTYTTVRENEIEVVLTVETVWNDETGESTSTPINRTEKIKVIDENTLLVNNEKLMKFENGEFVR